MVQTGFLLQHSHILPVNGGGSMRAQPVPSLHSLPIPQLSGALSFTFPGICLSGLHKWLCNQHMEPRTPLLPALL